MHATQLLGVQYLAYDHNTLIIEIHHTPPLPRRKVGLNFVMIITTNALGTCAVHAALTIK